MGRRGGQGEGRDDLTLRAAATYLPRLLLLFLFGLFYLFIYCFPPPIAATVIFRPSNKNGKRPRRKGGSYFTKHMRATMAFDGTVPAQAQYIERFDVYVFSRCLLYVRLLICARENAHVRRVRVYELAPSTLLFMAA